MTAVSVRTAHPGAAGCLRVTGSGYNVDGDVKCGDEPLLPAERALLRQLLLPAALCNDATLMPTVSAVAQHMIVSQTLAVPLPSTVAPIEEVEAEGAAAAASAVSPTPAAPAEPPAAGPSDAPSDATAPAAAAAAAPPAPVQSPNPAPIRCALSQRLAEAPGAPVTTVMGRVLPPDPPPPSALVRGSQTRVRALSSQPATSATPGLATPSAFVVAVPPDAPAAAAAAPAPAAPTAAPGAAGSQAESTAVVDAIELAMHGGGGDASSFEAGLAGGGSLSGGRVEWNSTGDPTEVALLALAMKAGLNLRTLNALFNECPRIDTVPLCVGMRRPRSRSRFTRRPSPAPPLAATRRRSSWRRSTTSRTPRRASRAASSWSRWAAGAAALRDGVDYSLFELLSPIFERSL